MIRHLVHVLENAKVSKLNYSRLALENASRCSVTVCAGVRGGPGSDLNHMPLFVPKFKPEVRDLTVQKAGAECPIIRRGSATGVRLAEVQWGIFRVVVKKPIIKIKTRKSKNNEQAIIVVGQKQKLVGSTRNLA